MNVQLFVRCFILLQILVLYDKLDAVDVNGILSFVSGLQQIDGSFIGDKWGKQTSS